MKLNIQPEKESNKKIALMRRKIGQQRREKERRKWAGPDYFANYDSKRFSVIK